MEQEKLTFVWIVNQINESFNEYTGSNEAILDAAHWIYEQHKLDILNALNNHTLKRYENA